MQYGPSSTERFQPRAGERKRKGSRSSLMSYKCNDNYSFASLEWQTMHIHHGKKYMFSVSFTSITLHSSATFEFSDLEITQSEGERCLESSMNSGRFKQVNPRI